MLTLDLGSQGLLQYEEIDILTLFKSNVNYNYMNNSFTYGDIVVTQVTTNQLFQEHQMQEN